jgi:hypothetical protein
MMTSNDLVSRLSMLGFAMFEGGSSQNANATLSEVVKGKDTRLWEGFPVMLANSLEKNWFSYSDVKKSLRSKRNTSIFNSLITMSLALYENLGLKVSQIEMFRKEFPLENQLNYSYLLLAFNNNEEFDLEGHNMSSERLKIAFANYYGEKQVRLTDLLSEREQHDLEFAMSQIFSTKQKELVMKKLKGEKLTKTEREYFSRVVKKKVMALANTQLHRLSQKLLS